MSLAVAFHVPHNEGSQVGIITGPDFNSGTDLVDLYEVDASIRSFPSKEAAEAWLQELFENDEGMPALDQVPGGWVGAVSYD
ncbi:MAG: hypothetical protein HOV97_05625 [Nonomuraea sp.]|nr:hypothetical protein [Nonomuraea sp.]